MPRISSCMKDVCGVASTLPPSSGSIGGASKAVFSSTPGRVPTALGLESLAAWNLDCRGDSGCLRWLCTPGAFSLGLGEAVVGCTDSEPFCLPSKLGEAISQYAIPAQLRFGFGVCASSTGVLSRMATTSLLKLSLFRLLATGGPGSLKSWGMPSKKGVLSSSPLLSLFSGSMLRHILRNSCTGSPRCGNRLCKGSSSDC
mmetsp:Transcript_32080/g.61739  ORF Transcript_32080/g.61739 Transcript_32080/m.61739 type:complete len:200 (+) Transcript_32080:1205-1804(+)